MKCLIVEDDFAARRLMTKYLSGYGDCDIAIDGNEAVGAFRQALKENDPYELICLDIVMPRMDGRQALKTIRRIESDHGIDDTDCVKVIIVTAIGDSEDIIDSLKDGNESYIIKPVKKPELFEEIKKLGFIEAEASK